LNARRRSRRVRIMSVDSSGKGRRVTAGSAAALTEMVTRREKSRAARVYTVPTLKRETAATAVYSKGPKGVDQGDKGSSSTTDLT
jgi:hypothetical protein